MNRMWFAIIAAFAAAPALASDVSASIGISQPGFYGQINIGNFPRPAVIYAQPVVIMPPPRTVVLQPVYMRVPPGHEKHWSKHCAEYDACGRKVYFVQEDWYQREYVPRYQQQGGGDKGQGKSKGKAKGHDD